MCGRFTLRTPSNLLVDQFLLPTDPQWPPRYNIAPTQPIAVVRLDAGGRQREGVLQRWGLIPAWAKDRAIGNRTINARAETVAEKPAFRAAFRRRRCLVPADGYYEWQTTGRTKQPYYIRLEDDRPFAFAGLWESWEGGGEGPLETCTIITAAANTLTVDIHPRMPVILDPAAYATWLDTAINDGASLQPLLKPYESAQMRLDPVSTYVNNPRHDSPDCIRVQKELF